MKIETKKNLEQLKFDSEKLQAEMSSADCRVARSCLLSFRFDSFRAHSLAFSCSHALSLILSVVLLILFCELEHR